MSLVKRNDQNPIRQPVKPWLLNHKLIDRYIAIYGEPDCYCCHRQVPTFMPGRFGDVVRIYCTNCALTMICTGVCFHE